MITIKRCKSFPETIHVYMNPIEKTTHSSFNIWNTLSQLLWKKAAACASISAQCLGGAMNIYILLQSISSLQVCMYDCFIGLWSGKDRRISLIHIR